jgi:hypothetical protein
MYPDVLWWSREGRRETDGLGEHSSVHSLSSMVTTRGFALVLFFDCILLFRTHNAAEK